MKERTYVMVKPGFALNADVLSYVTKRLKNAGLKIADSAFVKYNTKTATEHYVDHVGRPYFDGLVKYITSDIAFGMVVEGENAIETVRGMAGSAKNPEVGSIRYEVFKELNLEPSVRENVIHSSDSPLSAEREIGIFQAMVEEMGKTAETKEREI